MSLLTRRHCALPLIAVLALGIGSVSGQDAKSNWVNLLDGNDLTKNWTTTGNWKIDKEGVVSLEPRPGEKGWERYDAYLWSKKQYKDFEADFEYKVAKGGNSGFYFHVGDLKDPVAKGIEVQIYDSLCARKAKKFREAHRPRFRRHHPRHPAHQKHRQASLRVEPHASHRQGQQSHGPAQRRSRQ